MKEIRIKIRIKITIKIMIKIMIKIRKGEITEVTYLRIRMR